MAADDTTLQIQPQRPELVLAALRDNLVGMAGQVPPALGGPLTFFGGLAGWSASAVSVGDRVETAESAVADVTARAAGLGITAATTGDLAEALGGSVDPAAAPLLADLLAALTAAEHGAVQASQAAGPAGPTTTVEDLTTYLSARFGGGAHATAVTVIPGGYSKTTLLVDAVIDGEAQQIVLRQIPAGSPTDALAPEYGVLRAIWSPTITVPEPLWLEEEATVLGGPFFASRRSPGSPVGTVAGAEGNEVPATVVADIAAFLARLHQVDPAGIADTPVLPMRDAGEIVAAIDDFETRYATHVGPVPPRLRAVLGWLRAHVPTTTRTVVVHGDAGFQNTLAENGRMTAALDWERAHLGDAAEDLAYVKPPISEVFDWDAFLAAYAAAGGTVPDDDTLRFYLVWQDVWRHVECARLGQEFYTSGQFSSAIAGFVLGPQFLDSAIAGAFGKDAA